MTGERWYVEWRAGGNPERRLIDGQIVIGRSLVNDVVLDDPYVSRTHCTLELRDGRPFVDATRSLNRVLVDGTEVGYSRLASGQRFRVGNTTLVVVSSGSENDRPTLKLKSTNLILRASTRELVDPAGISVARFSQSEYWAFEALVIRHPHAASHRELGEAVWGQTGWDQYQLHRLLQRVRQRLGEAANLVENVRAAGYRLTRPIDRA